jgi:hypothetical protein
VKTHTLLDLRGNIPTAIIITDGKVHDVRALDDIPIEAGAIYIMARISRFQKAPCNASITGILCNVRQKAILTSNDFILSP